MKIIHICLGCFYVEGMGYQENIITKMHAKEGHSVYVLTSDFAFNGKGESIKKEVHEYANEFGVKVKVLDRSNDFLARYGKFVGLFNELQNVKPDIIFVHGGNFISLNDVIKYCKKTGCTLYIDQHSDYYNCPVKTLKQKIIFTGLFGHFMRKAIPYTTKFWGVTPWRCEYLNDVFKIPQNKIDLLIMGGDDDKIDFKKAPEIRKEIRKQLDISENDFVIVTGGKIDRTKNIHLLMQAVAELEGKVKLIVFGSPNAEMQDEITELSRNENIRFLDWIPSDKVYDYFFASDLCVFPGTHSVLWEQACACGIPSFFKYWKGMQHVKVNENAEFLYNDSKEEIKEKIADLCSNKEKYSEMKKAAEKCKKGFMYSEISKKAIAK